MQLSAIIVSLHELSDFHSSIGLAMLSLFRLIFLNMLLAKVKMFLEPFFNKVLSVWL